MCGIAGFFTTGTLDDTSKVTLERMLKTIQHRGPDGSGNYVNKDLGIAMGHTRLSINDLESGSQPIKSMDGNLAITVNGEFYDFKRYRSLAMAEGERYLCKSDSEIALTLYKKYGLGFVDYLRGEFAIALYDRDQDQLILVRDRFGIRPLYYHSSGDTFIYGSEVKTLLAHPIVPKELCPQSCLNQMMQVMVPGTSAFKDIKALNPGQFMVIKKNGKGSLIVNEYTYWDLKFPTLEEGYPVFSEQDHIERIRTELVKSIIFRLEADVPVGAYLSGGIDSCCILGLATGAMQSSVKAFTISFDHNAYDESGIAKKMAESMHADQEIIRLTADDLYGRNYVETVWHTERTFYNTLGVAKNLMSRRVRECGYKTVITGEGSDELFGGYPAFKRDMFMHGLVHEPKRIRDRYKRMLYESNRLFNGAILTEDQRSHPAFERLCGFTPSWIQPWMATLELVRPLMHSDIRNELKDYDPIRAIAEQINQEAVVDRHPLDIAQYTWIKTQLDGQILNWGGDRVDMANSMESRPAFLDHHVAEAAASVPPHLRIKGMTEKWVLREAVKGVLPEVLYRREKFAFMAPPAHTDKAKQKKALDLVAQYLTPQKINASGIFDAKAIDKFFKEYDADQNSTSLTRKDTVINHLLCLQIMFEHFVSKPRALCA